MPNIEDLFKRFIRGEIKTGIASAFVCLQADLEEQKASKEKVYEIMKFGQEDAKKEIEGFIDEIVTACLREYEKRNQ